VESSPQPWIEALRQSHDTLRALVEPMDEAGLRRQSYASDWSIAQVLSHLGSGAEIFGLFLDAGLSGSEPPGGDTFRPIWQAWNERSPQAQAADALASDEVLVKRLESLDAGERDRIRLDLFGMDLDLTGLTRMRLGEHAVHSWDVAVALDPAATVAAGAVNLVIDALGPVAARSGKPTGRPLAVRVTTTGPDREFTIEAGDSVRLGPAEANRGLPRLRLPAEAFIRLVYGRLDPAHTPMVEASEVDLDELRQIFPGF
jgi:uncharacterized protein (TIGR03083 family)